MIENLSPSRAKTFMQCPKRFHYESVLKLETPESIATAKGKLVHYVLDYLFDYNKDERSIEIAIGLVDIVWDVMTNQNASMLAVSPSEIGVRKKYGFYLENSDGTDTRTKDSLKYRELFSLNSKQELAFLSEAKECIKGYFNMENPKLFTPADRELYVKAKVAGVSLHGIIDRLDKITQEDGTNRWFVSDYKTGKPPKRAYVDDAFFQLEVYALILKNVMGIDVEEARLLYIREGSKEYILTRKISEEILQRTTKKLKRVWLEIKKSYKSELWPTNKGVLCDWCHFKSVCPAFVTLPTASIDMEGSSV